MSRFITKIRRWIEESRKPNSPRLRSRTFVTVINGHEFKVCLGYERDEKYPCEIAFVDRGKVGHGLDQIMNDLGIQCSRFMQHRDPRVGEERLAAYRIEGGL